MKILSLILFFVLTFGSIKVSYGSPLVFQATKEIKKRGIVEVGRFDATQFKQIRLLIIRDELDETKLSELDFVANPYVVTIYALVGNEKFEIGSSGSREISRYSEVIDTPPSQIKIEVFGQGKFRLFVWATQ